jgi:hypothetical protein
MKCRDAAHHEKLSPTERRALILDDHLSPRSVRVLSELVSSLAYEFNTTERTIRRDIEKLEQEGLVYYSNPGSKPFMCYAEKKHKTLLEDASPTMSVLHAKALLLTKQHTAELFPEAVFKKLCDEGIYEQAENVLLKAKQRNPFLKEMHFEQVASNDSLYQLHANPEISSSVIDAIKNALYDGDDLEVRFYDSSESVFVKPEKIQTHNGQQTLKVKQLDYPHTLKTINIADISEVAIVDYCPWASSQMRRAA